METAIRGELAMLSWVLAGMYLIEGAAYVCWVLPGRSLLSGAGSVVVIALGLRAAVVAYMFVVAGLWRTPRQAPMHLGVRGWIALIAGEYAALCLCYSLLHPFARWMIPRETGQTADGRIPVILVHGFFCNRGYWWSLGRRLRARGAGPVFTLSLSPLLAGLDRYAVQLEEKIAEACACTGARRVILVGHSMGGLVARACALRPGMNDRVLGIITLGSPHHGTHLAIPVRRGNLPQMRPFSRWLSRLEEQEKRQGRPPLLSIYSAHDNIVAPQDSARLEGAENVCLPGIGHLALAFHREVQRRVLEQIRRWLSGPDDIHSGGRV